MMNISGAVYGATAGVARNMQAGLDPFGASTVEAKNLFDAPGALQGGGDLNGTQATSLLFSQAGTDATRWQMPRKFSNPGNWCGII